MSVKILKMREAIGEALANPTIRPVLKSIHSADVYDLKTYIPKEPRKFGFAVQALIGTLGDDGEESFQFLFALRIG